MHCENFIRLGQGFEPAESNLGLKTLFLKDTGLDLDLSLESRQRLSTGLDVGLEQAGLDCRLTFCYFDQQNGVE